MEQNTDWQKYDKLTNKPEPKSSIYFKTKSGEILPGTFRGYDEFFDIWGKNHHDSTILEFKKREIYRKSDLNLPYKFQNKEWNVSIDTSRKNGFHWVANADKESDEIIVRGEKFEEVKKEISSRIEG